MKSTRSTPRTEAAPADAQAQPPAGGVRLLAAFVLLALLGLGLLLLEPIALRQLRLAQFDQFQRWQPRSYSPAAVRVVDIDEAALRAHGQWPWPRTRIADLVQRLAQAGASVVAFDVLMTEPDRTSPEAMARLWRQPALDPLLRALPDHDLELARSLQQVPVVLGTNLARREDGAQPVSQQQQPGHRIVTSGADPRPWLPAFHGAIWPIPPLAQAAAGVGALNLSPDADGIVRRVPLLLAQADGTVPGLATQALRIAQGARNLVISTDSGGVRSVRIGAHVAPTTAAAELWLHYSPEVPGRFISAARVLAGGLQPGEVKDHIVLVGSSAAGLMDQRISPMGEVIPGVLAHATALEQMLTGHFLQRPSWAAGLEALLLAAGVLILGLAASRMSLRWTTFTLALALACLAAGTWTAYRAGGWLLDAATPALAWVAACAVGAGRRYRATEQRQRWLRTALNRYISPNRVAHLVAHPDLLHLGGQRQVCSFVFTDLVGFTSLLESTEPEQAVARMNEYLDGMLEVVFRHEGTLDRIVGDAIAVLFSAPVPQADHRRRALACAMDLHAFASQFAAGLRSQGLPWGDTRIGVHSGEVIVGNFGGQRLFDYRALGDPVNTASRLEGANRHVGTLVLVSQAVLQDCPDTPVRPVGRLLLKGKHEPVTVATPEATLPAGSAPLADYLAAWALLQGPGADPPAARAAFGRLAGSHPADALIQMHARRLADGAADDLIALAEK